MCVSLQGKLSSPGLQPDMTACMALQGRTYYELQAERCPRQLRTSEASAAPESPEDVDPAELDPAAVAEVQQQHRHMYTYHLLHSPSYQVPTLCLRGSTAGTPPRTTYILLPLPSFLFLFLIRKCKDD